VIAQLRGRVVRQGEDHVILEVQGVGYYVTASARTLRHLARDEAALLLTELQITDETIRLYGFVDEAERSTFRILQTVQGVGARVALSLLGTLGPDGLATAVAAGDRPALARATGVGARLAARLVTELKDRLGDLRQTAAIGAAPSAATPGDEDALAALLRLGFGRSEAFSALGRVRARLGAQATVEALIREGLRELSRSASDA
jgi:holliday junction DNA helicase RuvA